MIVQHVMVSSPFSTLTTPKQTKSNIHYTHYKYLDIVGATSFRENLHMPALNTFFVQRKVLLGKKYNYMLNGGKIKSTQSEQYEHIFFETIISIPLSAAAS